jgi:outer membrane protein OmpA-like peptidoglycan-associated protein
MVAGYAEGRPSTASGTADERFDSARELAAARAQAVADYLDRHGIAEERLAVSGTGVHNAAPSSLAAKGGVEIHLLEPDATVVGWAAPGNTVRR